MFRAPKTVLDFFKAKPAEHSQERSKKRDSSEALHEIQVNGADFAKRIKAEPGKPLFVATNPKAIPLHRRDPGVLRHWMTQSVHQES